MTNEPWRELQQAKFDGCTSPVQDALSQITQGTASCPALTPAP